MISCICHRIHPSYCQSRVVVVTRYFLNGKLLSGRSFQLLSESLFGSAISRPRSIYRPNQTRFQPAVRAGVSLSQQTPSTCTVGLLCTAPRGQSTAAKGCCTARHHRLIARLAANQIDYRFGCLRPPPQLNVWSLYTRGYVFQAYYQSSQLPPSPNDVNKNLMHPKKKAAAKPGRAVPLAHHGGRLGSLVRWAGPTSRIRSGTPQNRHLRITFDERSKWPKSTPTAATGLQMAHMRRNRGAPDSPAFAFSLGTAELTEASETGPKVCSYQ